MSDQEFSDNEIDIESVCSPTNSSSDFNINDSKQQARAQHNALERRRRDNIKDMYTLLKNEIPNFTNDRVCFVKASRAQILKKAIEQIKESNAEISKLNNEVHQIAETNKKLREEIFQRMIDEKEQELVNITANS